MERLGLATAVFALRLGVTPQAVNQWGYRGQIPQVHKERIRELLRQHA